jgi:2'-5' RNA ligase
VEPIRTFIALELPTSVKSSLAQLQDSLKQYEHTHVKWLHPDSIHLTLKFLGNIDPGIIPVLTDAISEAAGSSAPFYLNLGHLGAFPNMRAPRVVWVGLEGEIENLLTLQESVERSLSTLGFPPENRRFSPHLTLGRIREKATPGDRRRLGEAVHSLKTEATAPFKINVINLMRSILTREGALYSCLASVALSGG